MDVTSSLPANLPNIVELAEWMNPDVPGLLRDGSPVWLIVDQGGLAAVVVAMVVAINQKELVVGTTEGGGVAFRAARAGITRIVLRLDNDTGRAHLAWWCESIVGVTYEMEEHAALQRAACNGSPADLWTLTELGWLCSAARKAAAVSRSRRAMAVDQKARPIPDMFHPERLKLAGFLLGIGKELLVAWLGDRTEGGGGGLAAANPTLVGQAVDLIDRSAKRAFIGAPNLVRQVFGEQTGSPVELKDEN